MKPFLELKLQLLSSANKSGLLYSVDAAQDKVYYYSVVAEGHKDSLNAADWARSFGDVIAGKSGGKPAAAQGSASLIEGVDKAEALALDFAKLHLKL